MPIWTKLAKFVDKNITILTCFLFSKHPSKIHNSSFNWQPNKTQFGPFKSWDSSYSTSLVAFANKTAGFAPDKTRCANHGAACKTLRFFSRCLNAPARSQSRRFAFCLFSKINTQLPPGSSVCERTYSKKAIECVPPYQLTKCLKLICKPGLGGRQTTNNSKFWRHVLWILLIDISLDRQQVTRGGTPKPFNWI